jgi:hypothetical protein
MKMGRLRKKAAGKARAGTDFKSVPIMRRTVAYSAMTKDEAQRSIRTFFEAVMAQLPCLPAMMSLSPSLTLKAPLMT